MLNEIRALLGIVGGGALGVIIAHLILGLLTPTVFGVCTAIIAACVIGIYLIRALQADRDTDKQRMRQGREQVWARRDECGWPLCSYEPHECPEARRTA